MRWRKSKTPKLVISLGIICSLVFSPLASYQAMAKADGPKTLVSTKKELVRTDVSTKTESRTIEQGTETQNLGAQKARTENTRSLTELTGTQEVGKGFKKQTINTYKVTQYAKDVYNNPTKTVSHMADQQRTVTEKTPVYKVTETYKQTKYRTEARVRPVTKYRTVTKYRKEARTRQVLKSRQVLKYRYETRWGWFYRSRLELRYRYETRWNWFYRSRQVQYWRTIGAWGWFYRSRLEQRYRYELRWGWFYRSSWYWSYGWFYRSYLQAYTGYYWTWGWVLRSYAYIIGWYYVWEPICYWYWWWDWWWGFTWWYCWWYWGLVAYPIYGYYYYWSWEYYLESYTYYGWVYYWSWEPYQYWYSYWNWESYYETVYYYETVWYWNWEYYTYQEAYWVTEWYWNWESYQELVSYYETVWYWNWESYEELVSYWDTEYYWETETYYVDVPYEVVEEYIDYETYYVDVPYDEYTDNVYYENGTTEVTMTDWATVKTWDKVIGTDNKGQETKGAEYASGTSTYTTVESQSILGKASANTSGIAKSFSSNAQIGRSAGKVTYSGIKEMNATGVNKMAQAAKLAEEKSVATAPSAAPSTPVVTAPAATIKGLASSSVQSHLNDLRGRHDWKDLGKALKAADSKDDLVAIARAIMNKKGGTISSSKNLTEDYIQAKVQALPDNFNKAQFLLDMLDLSTDIFSKADNSDMRHYVEQNDASGALELLDQAGIQLTNLNKVDDGKGNVQATFNLKMKDGAAIGPTFTVQYGYPHR